MTTVAQPVGRNFPRPKPVPPPSGAIPAPDPDTPWRFILGSTDITALVFTATWRHGDQQPNRVGQVSRPADGNLTLTMPEWWSPLNPHPRLPTYPGATLVITNRAGQTFFHGFSKGVLASSAPTSDGRPDVALMPIYGRLHRASGFNDGVFLKLPGGTPLITDVFRQISARADEAGDVEVLGSSGLRVHGPQLNAAGVLSSGRNLVNIMHAYNMLAVAEGGRIYDRPDGPITFETYKHRLNGATARRTWHISPRHAHLLDPERLVINVMSGESTELASTGTRTLLTIPPLPQRMTIPSGVRRSFEVSLHPASASALPQVAQEVAQSIKDYAASVNRFLGDVLDNAAPPTTALAIESIEPLREPADYTWDGPGRPDVEFDAHTIRIYFDNRNGSGQATAVLKQIRGNVAKPEGGQRIYSDNDASIGIYGKKSASYPSKIVQGFTAGSAGVLRQRADVQALLDRWVAVYSGVDGDGNPRPLYPVRVRYIPDTIEPIYPSDLVLLTWRSPWVDHCHDYPMWVDAVEWDIDSTGLATVNLLLSPTVSATLNPRYVRRPDEQDLEFQEVGFVPFVGLRRVGSTVPFLRTVGHTHFIHTVGFVPFVNLSTVSYVPFTVPTPPPWSAEAWSSFDSGRPTIPDDYVRVVRYINMDNADIAWGERSLHET